MDLYVSSVPHPGSLKGKQVHQDVGELDSDDAEDDVLWGKSSVMSDSGFMENIPGKSATRAQKNLHCDMGNKLAEGS